MEGGAQRASPTAPATAAALQRPPRPSPWKQSLWLNLKYSLFVVSQYCTEKISQKSIFDFKQTKKALRAIDHLSHGTGRSFSLGVNGAVETMVANNELAGKRGHRFFFLSSYCTPEMILILQMIVESNLIL